MTEIKLSEPVVEAANNKRRGRFARNVLLLYCLAGLAVAWATPRNVLEYEWARGFVNFMSFIPYVEKVGQASSAHPIAPFFAAVMFVLSMFIFWPLLQATYSFPQKINNSRVRVRQTLKWVGMVIFIVWLVIWTIFDHNFTTRLGRLEISSRVGIGIFGTISMAGVPFFSVAVIHCVKNWRHILYGDFDELVKRVQKFTS